MKIKYYYHISKNGELWGEFCSIVDGEKYNIGYSVFFSRKLTEIKPEGIDYLLKEIEKIKNGEKECVEGYGETLDFFYIQRQSRFYRLVWRL